MFIIKTKGMEGAKQSIARKVSKLYSKLQHQLLLPKRGYRQQPIVMHIDYTWYRQYNEP